MTSMIFDVIGRDHASKVLKDVGEAAKGAEGKMSKMKAAGAVAFAALAAGAVEFGKKSVDKFQEVGTETLTLQRQLGLTAQQASRLRFAGEETGVSAQQLGTTFGILSKHLSANDKAWQSLGISTKDATGKTKSMNDLIPQVADKFAKLPNGAQKTALAMQLFGRSGKDLLPFLNKGADGIKELSAESDKYGDTLNSKDTAAVHRNVIAKRELGAAVSGLEIQLGQKLLPVVTSIVTAFTSAVLWFSKLGSTTKAIIGVVAALVAVIAVIVELTKVWTAVQTAFNVVMDANPISLVILAIAALVIGVIIAYKKVGWFRDGVNAAFHAIVVAVSAAVGFIKSHWMLLLAILTGPIGLAVAWIIKHWKSVTSLFSGVGRAIGKAMSGVASVIEAPFKTAFAVIMAGIHAIEAAFNAVKSALGGGGPSNAAALGKTRTPAGGHIARAFGGPVWRGVTYDVGEAGRERFTAPADGFITPHSAMASSSRSGGDVQVSVPLIIQVEGRSLYQGLLTFKRKNGITSLGLG